MRTRLNLWLTLTHCGWNIWKITYNWTRQYLPPKFWFLLETFVGRCLFNFSSASCHDGDATWQPCVGSGAHLDPLRLLAGCRKRQLNQAPLKLCGQIWLLTMDCSERGDILKSGSSWEPFRKNSALCSWQEYQSWFKERRNPQAPNRSAWGNIQKHYITVRDLLRFSTSSQRFS